MKPEFEKIEISEHSSLYINCIDRDFFDAPWHYHPEYEITLILKGEGIRFTGDNAEEYYQLDLVALASDIPHHWKSDKTKPGSTAIVIQFIPDSFGVKIWDIPEMDLVKDLLQDMRFGLKFEADIEIVELFQKIVTVDGMARLNYFFLILSKLAQLHRRRLLSLNYFQSTEIPNNRLEKIFHLVKKHFKENIRVQDIATVVGLTRESFSRYFKEKTKQTFIKYLNIYRIGYASKLLKETNMKIIEIAYESGFQSLSNFNRQFKKLKKRSPLEYKKWIGEQKE